MWSTIFSFLRPLHHFLHRRRYQISASLLMVAMAFLKWSLRYAFFATSCALIFVITAKMLRSYVAAISRLYRAMLMATSALSVWNTAFFTVRSCCGLRSSYASKDNVLRLLHVLYAALFLFHYFQSYLYSLVCRTARNSVCMNCIVVKGRFQLSANWMASCVGDNMKRKKYPRKDNKY